MKSNLVGLVFLFTLLNLFCFSQDTVFMTNQRHMVVKVIEVDQQAVKYRKLDNLDGPLYSTAKHEIIRIRYLNGSEDLFETEMASGRLSKERLLELIKKPGSSVYVMSFDSASVIHAKNAIQNGTPWTIVSVKSQADFIVRFAYASIGMGDKKGKAQFLDPQTETLVFETGSVNTTMSWDINTKRGVIDKVVRKEIGKFLK